MRSLLIQGAQSLLRQRNLPLSRWGWRLLVRKSSRNELVVAVARKMVVAVWYLLKGLWDPLLELTQRAQVKLSKITGQLKQLTQEQRAQCFQEARRKLLEEGHPCAGPDQKLCRLKRGVYRFDSKNEIGKAKTKNLRPRTAAEGKRALQLILCPGAAQVALLQSLILRSDKN